jgi:hypothetical protein
MRAELPVRLQLLAARTALPAKRPERQQGPLSMRLFGVPRIGHDHLTQIPGARYIVVEFAHNFRIGRRRDDQRRRTRRATYYAL